MNNIGLPRKEINPFYQLLLLLLYAALGAFVFTLIACGVIAGIYGIGGLMKMLDGQINAGNLGAFKLLQLATTFGLFLAPPMFLALTENTRIKHFYGFKKPELKILVIVTLIMIVSMPFMEWTASLNQKMMLPDFLRPVEAWMREQEDKAMKATYMFLTVKNGWDLYVNLFVIALVPGIAEEFMFRGGIQRVFSRMFANHHVAIWAAAIVFSAMHIQFFGFLPRMLLGAGFGYIYYWTGSLWYAMFAHFLNNAYSVIVAYYMQMHHIPLESADKTIDTAWYGYLISALLTAGMLIILKKAAQKRNEQQLD